MGKPATKADLLAQMQAEYHKLQTALAALRPDDMIQPGVCEHWSVKDILAHLAAWSQMTLGWCAAHRRGENPRTPADDLTWQQIPLLNQRIYEQHKDRPLDTICAEFEQSYRQMLETTQAFPEEELFARGRYRWLKTTSLAAYLSAASESHYRWAHQLIRKWVKAGKPAPA